MENDPAKRPATPVNKSMCEEMEEAAATPTTSAAIETMPSLDPRTDARSQFNLFANSPE